MKTTKKGFLTAASILTIIACGFAMLMSAILFLSASMCSEETIKDIYKDSKEYTYYEEADGSYYFVEIDDDSLQEVRISSEEIQFIAKITSNILTIGAVVVAAFGIAKLILSIKILNNNKKNKFGLGSTIGLLVLSVLTVSVIETAFLIVALCLKNKNEIENIEM